MVALRKESVDRNIRVDKTQCAASMSLSARRAWIEILGWLRVLEVTRSLSARRAWIEILYYGDNLTFADGSLSARRAWIEI